MRIFGRRPGFPSRRVVEGVPPERTPGEVAEKVLEFLRTGEVRELEEIAGGVGLPEEKAEEILDFLVEGGLVKKSARITDLGLEFLKLPEEE